MRSMAQRAGHRCKQRARNPEPGDQIKGSIYLRANKGNTNRREHLIISMEIVLPPARRLRPQPQPQAPPPLAPLPSCPAEVPYPEPRDQRTGNIGEGKGGSITGEGYIYIYHGSAGGIYSMGTPPVASSWRSRRGRAGRAGAPPPAHDRPDCARPSFAGCLESYRASGLQLPTASALGCQAWQQGMGMKDHGRGRGRPLTRRRGRSGDGRRGASRSTR